MKIAFCLFKYFPYGGLQRDFMRMAEVCAKRGHEIHVFTMQWEGEQKPGFHLHIIKPSGFQNHTRCQSFILKLKEALAAGQYDVVVGFNKMPHLDIYYAADVCYRARINQQRGWWYRLLPRYQQWVELEKAVFAKGKSTQIMLISPLQQKEFMTYYQTEPERFHLMPPGISKDRLPPANADTIRISVRQRHHLAESDHLLLMVGSGFKTKGLDRALKSIAALPAHIKHHCQLIVIGQDNPAVFKQLAAKLMLADKVHFLGGRDDVRDYMLAADVLLHPAYHENTGTVLLEAMLTGLPVLTTDVCGYAHYVSDFRAGTVISSPFQQEHMNKSLQYMLLSANDTDRQQAGSRFATEADIYSLPEKAADLIEQKVGKLDHIPA